MPTCTTPERNVVFVGTSAKRGGGGGGGGGGERQGDNHDCGLCMEIVRIWAVVLCTAFVYL